MNTLSVYDKATQAKEYIESKITKKPTLALILGSGLGEIAEILQNKIIIPYKDIPHLKVSTVQGHSSNLIFGDLSGRAVVMMQGRLHYYEGHSMHDIVFPIRIMKLLGVEKLLVTNASGGINKMLNPGDLMIMKDHINLQGSNPLIGPNDDRFGPRFPDMSNAYDLGMRETMKQQFLEEKIDVKEGVYVAFIGPSFETKGEIEMASRFGADAVGMSTVPEVIVANHMGIKVAGISCVCNLAAGISLNPLSAEEVFESAALVKDKFKELVIKLIPIL